MGHAEPRSVRDGAATELNEIATKLNSQYGQGKGMLGGEEINGSDIEAEMGNLDRTPAEYAEMWASWHDNVGAPMKDDSEVEDELLDQLGQARNGSDLQKPSHRPVAVTRVARTEALLHLHPDDRILHGAPGVAKPLVDEHEVRVQLHGR